MTQPNLQSSTALLLRALLQDGAQRDQEAARDTSDSQSFCNVDNLAAALQKCGFSVLLANRPFISTPPNKETARDLIRRQTAIGHVYAWKDATLSPAGTTGSNAKVVAELAERIPAIKASLLKSAIITALPATIPAHLSVLRPKKM